ncbi:MAG: hypothetical protein ACXWHZ_08965 [Usitatibacter sp.]
MTSRFLLLSIVSLAAPLIAQQAAARTIVPADVQADRTTIQQDRMDVQIQDAQSILQSDQEALMAALAPPRLAPAVLESEATFDLRPLRGPPAAIDPDARRGAAGSSVSFNAHAAIPEGE